jgi:enamine deaminase RidA (YjgF/YER057c/UK114 family)
MGMSNRGERFKKAARAAYQHVQQTVEAYGDHPEDILADMDADATFRMMLKYVKRKDRPERYDGEKLHDALKIMHTAAEYWLKLQEEDAEIPRTFSATESGEVNEMLLGMFGMKP